MFGAPPVGHVMDPQFKPLFFWGLWKYVCKCKYVVSTQLVAWQKDTSRYNSIFPLKMHSNCEHHMILCISMEDLGAYTRSLDTYFL